MNKNEFPLGLVGGVVALVLGVLLVTGALSLEVILGVGLIVVGVLALVDHF